MNGKNNPYASGILIIFLAASIVTSCAKDEIYQEDDYYSELSFPDSSAFHPKAAIYQEHLDKFIEGGGLGMSVMIRDAYGTWLGSGGYADIKSGLKVRPGHRFLIASSSKTFTAACVFSMVEDGLLSLDDPVNRWIDKSVCDRIDNANESTVLDLLGHTSSIRDLYGFNHLMPYLNRSNNNWEDRDMLEFVYGKKAYFEVGTWMYSNVNYLLLGMIMEEASDQSLKEIYEERIFQPLGLRSAYYETGTERVAPGLVKGYTDVYNNNTFIEALDLYEDDIGLGGDGGIAINPQDLGKFLDELLKGNVVSQTSLEQMTDWFEGGYSSEGMAGYGLYISEGDYGPSIGHGGGIVGFESGMEYFQDHDVTLIMLTNTDLILTSEEYDNNYNAFSINLKRAIFE